MKNQNSMNRSSIRGISLSVVIIFSMILILIPNNSYADEIDAKGIGLDETVIITLENNSKENIKTVRMWLGENLNFKSFKTEKGWVGDKTPQGVIIFTSSETIKIGESVKFGIKTDEVDPIINWKALDEKDQIIKTGVVKSSKLSIVNQNPTIISNENYENSGTSIFSDSTFRIIPDKPNSDSTIRVTGDQFGSNQKFEFYIDSQKLGNFITDEQGHFITTMQIPNLQKQERVDFKIISYDGAEKKLSIRVGEDENRIPNTQNFKLTVEGIPNISNRGDIIEIFGKGIPNTAITAKIIDPTNNAINTRIAEVDNAGNWKIEDGINIPYDAVFGKYGVIVDDGRNQILKNWEVKTDKTILIKSAKIMFDAGDLIKLNGTVLPNKILELILEDSFGDEMASEIVEVDESGFVEFQYQSIENDDKEGTWTLIATQEKIKEFIYFGYDELPIIPINIEFDKSNYQTSEDATISFIGKPSEKLTMIIITPAGNILGNDIIIQLRADGKGEHNLELKSFSSGIYTAVVKKGNSQHSETFSVGLQTGSGNIEAQITQTEYQVGERILVLGNTNPNSLLEGVLIDPNGIEIKRLEIASNNVGIFTEERFKIPVKGTTGLWKIVISSGSNSKPIEFNVFSTEISRGMIVTVPEKVEQGDLIKISIIASHKTSITIEIVDESGNIIDKTLTCNTTKEFICETFWPVPKDMALGKYIIKVNDAISSGQATVEIISN